MPCGSTIKGKYLSSWEKKKPLNILNQIKKVETIFSVRIGRLLLFPENIREKND